MKKLFVGVASVALLLFGSLAFADMKIGDLDVSKVVASAPQLDTAKEKLKKQFEPREKAITAAQKQLRSDVEDFKKNSPTMKEEDSKAAQQKMLDEQKKLQDMQVSFQNDLGTAQTDAMHDILKNIETVVNKIAIDQKFDLILSKTSIAYNNASLDVTDEVIKAIKK